MASTSKLPESTILFIVIGEIAKGRKGKIFNIRTTILIVALFLKILFKI